MKITDKYLLANSGLPGPRANLTLAQQAADAGDEPTFRRWLRSDEEYLALCGAIGIGRLIAAGNNDLWPVLRTAADDERWRVREGVAMGLQRVGDEDIDRLLAEVDTWVGGSALLRRAAVAGLCEPRLLKDGNVAARAVALVDRVTDTLLATAVPQRRAADVRTLRQALGYCWSVAVAAAPATGVPAFRRLQGLDDPDARWIVAENLKKKRLATVLS
ncbi:MAG TPA: hypothetical protein VFE14_19030 [Micromonosporaceae bacterium]|jgi:hypothetical protein|nr:hypothetical protein [Micromonosporaceae bacterium]